MKLSRHRGLLILRTSRLLGLVQAVLLGIAVAYWWVQVANGDHYRQMSDNNRLRKLSLEAPRGLIVDRDGRHLVENVPSYSLLIDASLSRDIEASLAFAGGILGRTNEEMTELFRDIPRSRYQQVELASNLDLAQVSQFAVQQLEHPEFETVARQRRLYRYGHHTAHLLGYLGRVSQADLDTGLYRRDDMRGKEGIEVLFENHLRGTRGEQLVVVDNRGRRVEHRDPVSARQGKELRTTLDIRLQQEAALLLEGQRGAIVALDPRNGDILALVSAPSFNPNAFVRGLSGKEWSALSQDPGKPLQNRALLHAPPGSVFKIVMALAGLESGIIDLETRTFCRGAIKIYNHRYRCWKSSGHGWEDLKGAFRDSCDVYFYLLGQKLGIDAIANASRKLHLGELTRIGLSGEVPGLVPDSAWSVRARGNPWYPGETISVSIGQGPILTTPLQVALMVASVARGQVVKPRLTLEEEVRLGPVLPYREEHLVAVRDAMESVVMDPGGTGRAARVEGMAVAGKTGTAQVVRQETWTSNDELPPEHRDHAWFASYAPADDPRLVVVVFVEHGGGGSTTAAPIARRIFERFLDLNPA